jgi:hypothetical protein
MTAEKNCYLGLADILAVQFICTKCKTAITLPISQISEKIPTQCACPECDNTWLDTETPQRPNITKTLVLLSQLKKTMEGLRFSIRLQTVCQAGEERQS